MRSDLSMLQELGESLTPESGHPPAEVRHRVMNGMRRPERSPRLLSRVTGVRLAWRLGAAAGLAASIGVVLASVQTTNIAGGSPAPPGQEARSGAPADTTVGAPGDPASARQVLRLAAQHAAATPVLPARPDQFLFIDSVEVQATTDVQQGRYVRKVSGPQRTRTWLSVDGTRDGLVIQEPPPSSAQRGPSRTHIDGCRNGLRAETIDRPETTPKVACTPEPAYRPGSVPIDPDRLFAHLYATASADPVLVGLPGHFQDKPGKYVRLSTDQRAFQEIASLLYQNHAPAVQEAAFRAAERIPGVQVRGGVADASGRTGVAVTRTEAGTREELVFDPTTFAYLGHNMIAAEWDLAGAQVIGGDQVEPKGTARIMRGPAPEPGEVIYKSALLRTAIVDTAGQRP